MKRILAMTTLLTLSGCATSFTDHSPAQTYRPAGEVKPWVITGRIDRRYEETITGTLFRHTLIVEINGEEALRGELDREMMGEVAGVYRDAPVDAVCTSRLVNPQWRDVRCMILVNNERAVTLTF